jgi:pimeloyl-ACP methyl ester carboxylesterase
MYKKISLLLLIVTSLTVYVLFLRKNHIVTTEEARAIALQPASKFFTWKGNDIHYTDEGQGPVLLMIHGFAGSFYNFQAVTEQMRDSFRVIRVDLPGMGLSDFHQSGEGTDYFREYKDFFRVFLDSANVDSCIVIGNSLGGLMASLVAISFPDKVKGLVLLNSAGYDMKNVLKKGAGPLRWGWFRNLAERGLPMYAVKYSVTYPFADKSKVDPTEFPIDYALVNRKGVLTSLIDLASSGQEPDTSAFARIKTPSLIIWGKEDNIIPVDHAERFKRDLSNSQMKIYSPCGHMPMMELPDSIVADLKKFSAELQ